jgi:hypothetical protein
MTTKCYCKRSLAENFLPTSYVLFLIIRNWYVRYVTQSVAGTELWPLSDLCGQYNGCKYAV